MNKLNFDKIKTESTVVGGLENGEYKVLLTGFDVVPDSKGNKNYQFEFTLVDYNMTKRFNTSLYNMYKQAVSNIGIQLGYAKGELNKDAEILEKATTEQFSIWINKTDREYINFHEYVEETETDVEL